MKIWVDDERPAPDDTWLRAETSAEAKSFLYLAASDRAETGEPIVEVSLDHDLGGEDNGFIVLDWMIERNVWPEELTIHTSNPSARKRMLAAANAEGPADMAISVIYDHLKKA